MDLFLSALLLLFFLIITVQKNYGEKNIGGNNSCLKSILTVISCVLEYFSETCTEEELG